MSMVAGIIYPTGDKNDPATLPRREPVDTSLAALRTTTGGTRIQELRVGQGIVAICAEDAYQLALPLNGYATVALNMLTADTGGIGGPLAGVVVLVGINDDGVYVDLPTDVDIYTGFGTATR